MRKYPFWTRTILKTTCKHNGCGRVIPAGGRVLLFKRGWHLCQDHGVEAMCQRGVGLQRERRR